MDQPLRRQQGAWVLAGPLLAGPLLAGCLAWLLAGCSGTPFGDRLGGSFSSPPPTTPPGAANGVSNGATTGAATGAPNTGAPTNGAPTKAQKLAPTAPGAAPAPPLGQSGASQGADGAAKPASKTGGVSPPQAPGTKQPPAAATNLQPVPYRITLKLPLTDPAAPAESVTQALRAAGLRFEVEMIERVQPASSSPSVAPPR